MRPSWQRIASKRPASLYCAWWIKRPTCPSPSRLGFLVSRCSIYRYDDCDSRDHILPAFKYRCRTKLEDLGDSAVNSSQYDEAISQYTAALSLDPSSLQDLLVKRSKARANKGEWKDALNDANEVVHFQFVHFRPC